MTKRPILSIEEKRETFVRPDGSTYSRDDIFVKLFVTFRDAMLAQLKGPQLSVYLALALHCGEHMTAWPSLATIARETGYGKKAVIGAIRSLIDRGLIEKELRKTDAGDSDVNLYTVKGFVSMRGKPKGSILKTPPGILKTPQVVSSGHPKKNHKKNDDGGGLQAAQRLAYYGLVYLGVSPDAAHRLATEQDSDTVIGWCAALQHSETQSRATNLPGLLVSKLNSDAVPAVYQESIDAFVAKVKVAIPEIEKLLCKS